MSWPSDGTAGPLVPEFGDPAPPAHLWVPPGARGNYGDVVADLADRMGRPLDVAQRVAVDALTSYGPGGKWLALEGLIKQPRRNGKTAGVITAIAFADLFLWKADRIAWTAHLFKTTSEAFGDHQKLIARVPEFSRRVKQIHSGKGEESIELHSGARIDYLARSKGGGRGLEGKRVVIDEALFFSAESAEALLPILATADNAQIMYGSSACKVESTGLRALTRRGRAGNDPSLVYVDWSAPGGWANPGCRRGAKCPHTLGTAQCALDDPNLWLAANPAVAAGRIAIGFLEKMRRTLSPLGFGREFLGWDEDGPEDTASPIDLDLWDSRADALSSIAGPKVWAIDVTPAGTRTSISVAGQRTDGRPHLELIENGPGTGWVVARMRELLAAHETRRIKVGEKYKNGVILDPAGPGGELSPRLKAANIDPYLASSQDVGQGCAALLTGIRDDALTHIGQQEVHDALDGAGRRELGDGGWALSRRHSEVDISPIMSFALALQALRLAESAPVRAPLVARA